MLLRRMDSAGYTLIELLVVTSIIAIISSIALPKYVNLVQKSREGNLKGNLGSLRSALSIYYSDNGGVFPSCTAGADSSVLGDALTPKYIDKVPTINSGLHPPVSTVYCDADIIPGSVHDSQGWYYDGTAPADANFGSVWIACDHTDLKSSAWTSY